ncbi:MAG: septation protein SepH [Arachnia propionica]|uniref:septation protein SepH n=1 Tax=Arachnia propionica TaxID=1750 RepID=UPI0026FB6A89|nr:septation protein SepH [Arachnia propionica]
MESALSPREIQTRIRSGATLAEVAAEAGVEEARLEGFAKPVLAEREHIALTALSCAVRRRGDGAGHRRLGELLTSRLQARSIDADEILWDAWREPDLRWRVVGRLDSLDRTAEFLFDTRGRFSVADNPDARWMIGEELPGPTNPDNENTVDFDDEFALVRATSQPESPPAVPGDDVPSDHFAQGPATSELDDLYDMLSGVSEDSVRIYVGLEDEDTIDDALEAPQPEDDPGPLSAPAPEPEPEPEPTIRNRRLPEPIQEALVEGEASNPPPRRKPRRASVPSWDEIMFGSPR